MFIVAYAAALPSGSRGRRRGMLCVLVGLILVAANYSARSFPPELGAQFTRTVQLEDPSRRTRAFLEEKARVTDVARRVGCAVVFLGQLDEGYGTGLVISRQQRLVVTAGHVADMFSEASPLYCVAQADFKPRRVEKVWYHPRTMRRLDCGMLVNSFDPADGKIEYPAPDLAVVQLAQDGGDLPNECETRINVDPRTCDGQAVGFIGFFGLADGFWPTANGPALANLAISVLHSKGSELERTDSRSSDYFYCDGYSALEKAHGESQELDGCSGGPAFTGDGQILGILIRQSHHVSLDKPGYITVLSIDCLRELITYHKLDGLVPGRFAPAKPRADWGPDPRLREFRLAVWLVRQAAALRWAGKYAQSVEKCEEAAKINPNYAGALLERSTSYLFFLGSDWQRLSDAEKRQYAFWALSDAVRANELDPKSNRAALISIQSKIFHAAASPEPSWFRPAIEETTQFLSPDLTTRTFTPYEISFLHNLRRKSRLST